MNERLLQSERNKYFQSRVLTRGIKTNAASVQRSTRAVQDVLYKKLLVCYKTHPQSEATKYYSGQLVPKFVQQKERKKISQAVYELEDVQTRAFAGIGTEYVVPFLPLT